MATCCSRTAGPPMSRQKPWLDSNLAFISLLINVNAMFREYQEIGSARHESATPLRPSFRVI